MPKIKKHLTNVFSFFFGMTIFAIILCFIFSDLGTAYGYRTFRGSDAPGWDSAWSVITWLEVIIYTYFLVKFVGWTKIFASRSLEKVGDLLVFLGIFGLGIGFGGSRFYDQGWQVVLEKVAYSHRQYPDIPIGQLAVSFNDVVNLTWILPISIAGLAFGAAGLLFYAILYVAAHHRAKTIVRIHEPHLPVQFTRKPRQPKAPSLVNKSQSPLGKSNRFLGGKPNPAPGPIGNDSDDDDSTVAVGATP